MTTTTGACLAYYTSLITITCLLLLALLIVAAISVTSFVATKYQSHCYYDSCFSLILHLFFVIAESRVCDMSLAVEVGLLSGKTAFLEAGWEEEA